MRRLPAFVFGWFLLASLAMWAGGQDAPAFKKLINDNLPDPDGKPADMSRPVKVFVMMGQSNMLEMGRVYGDRPGTLEYAVKREGLYPFLIDDQGNWTVRRDVRFVAVMGSGGPDAQMRIRYNG